MTDPEEPSKGELIFILLACFVMLGIGLYLLLHGF